MNKKIEDKTGTYIEIPRAKIKFASKEAETIFDLSLENDWLEQEKQTLKEQLEGVREERDYLFNKLSLQNKYLAEENQELKKQLENCYCNRTDCSSRIKDSKKYDSLVQAKETQQKEFIEWLEAMRIMYQNEYKDVDVANHYNCVEKEYKEIIGLSDEKVSN